MHIYCSISSCLPFVSLPALFVTFQLPASVSFPSSNPRPHPPVPLVVSFLCLTPLSLLLAHVSFSILYPYAYTRPIPLSCRDPLPLSQSPSPIPNNTVTLSFPYPWPPSIYSFAISVLPHFPTFLSYSHYLSLFNILSRPLSHSMSY